MKTANFAEEQDSICSKTIKNRNKGGLDVSKLRCLKQLKKENRQLKKQVTDLSLDKQMLQELLRKNFETNPE